MIATFAALLLTSTPKELHVEENRLVENGKTVILRGVNVPSFEPSNEGDHVFRSCRVALEDWNANFIRLPLSQDRWFGHAEGQKDRGADYKFIVNEIVDLTTARGAYVALALDWSDVGVWARNMGPQHGMPDRNSLEFWKDVAHRYRKNPHVLFDLYDEPHNVTWEMWSKGGAVTENGLTYQAVGFRQLVETARAAGAKNVILAAGLDWGYDLRGVLTGFALPDPTGCGVVYESHVPPRRTDLDACVGAAAERVPVLISMVGGSGFNAFHEDLPGWAAEALQWIKKHELSWNAWSFYPSGNPSLIGDWKYTPTDLGAIVKQALADSR